MPQAGQASIMCLYLDKLPSDCCYHWQQARRSGGLAPWQSEGRRSGWKRRRMRACFSGLLRVQVVYSSSPLIGLVRRRYLAVSIGRSLGSALGRERDAGLTRYLSMPGQPTAGALFHAPLACCRRSRASQHLTASSSSPSPTAAAAGRLADGLLIRRIQANIDASGRCESIVCTVQMRQARLYGTNLSPIDTRSALTSVLDARLATRVARTGRREARH